MQKIPGIPIHLGKVIQKSPIIFLVFLILPYVFFAIGVNVFSIALAPGDGLVFGLPTKILMSRLELWNPYIQSGTFPFKDIGWQALYPPGILVMRIFPNSFGYNLLLLAHYSIAGSFTFLYLRRINLKLTAAYIGGITFMFCGFLSAHKGHHSMVMAASYLPVILYLFERFLHAQKISWLLLTALAFGLSILADYTAVPMYIGMILLPYILFRVLSGEEYRGQPVFRKLLVVVGVSVLIFGLGLLIAAVEILPILESLKYVTRETISYGFFASYSFDYKLLPLLIFPYFFGTQSPAFYQPYYFGPWNLTELTGYMGIFSVLFATLSLVLFRKRNSQIYFWTAVALFAFVLVLGDSTPVYKLMYRVPVYKMFRASARNWLEVNFAVATLSSLFIHYLITDSQFSKSQYFSRVSGIVILLLTAIAFTLISVKSWNFPREMEQILQKSLRINSPAIYIPLSIVVLSIILLYFLYWYRGRSVVWMIVSIIIFFDLFSFGHFHDTWYMALDGKSNEVADFLNTSNADKNQYRILPLGVAASRQCITDSLNIRSTASALPMKSV